MPKKPNPMKKLIDQFGEVLNSYLNADKESLNAPLPDDIGERLAIMRLFVDKLKDAHEKAIQEEGIDEEEILREIAQNPGQIPPEDLKLLLRASRYNAASRAITTSLENYLENDSPKLQKRKNYKRTEEGKQLRKRDFRRRKGWKKL